MKTDISLCKWISSLFRILLFLEVGLSSAKTRKEVLEQLMTGYDARIPPNYEDDHATNIYVQIFLVNLDSISETTMDFKVDIFLRTSWNDSRLIYDTFGYISFLELDTKSIDAIWVPDLYFSNEKNGAFHDITIPNRLMHLYPSGRVYYSLRLSLTLTCYMRLQKYPFDNQICPIKMESYGYTTENIIFHWAEQPIIRQKNLHLPQFEWENFTLGDCTATYGESNYTCISAFIHITRNYGYHITQIYIPSMLVVILSWVSFWLDIDAVPARISLGLLTVLTMTTQSSGARANLPRVSYTKAIDVWMAVCLVFVFAGLIEFAYVNVLARVEKRRATMYGTRSPSPTEKTPFEKDQRSPLRRTTLKSVASRQKARKLDKISRIIFPGVFIGFNLIYWIVYFTWDLNVDNTDI